MASASPYRVSTITCNGSLNTTVDLLKFFDNFELKSTAAAAEGIVWANYRGKCARGVYPKKPTSVPPDQRKSFDNQVTVLYKMPAAATEYYPNVKIFRNGNLQMTGIRSAEDGEYIIQVVAAEVQRIADECDPEIIQGSVLPGGFVIRMINSDFSVPFEIRRKCLHKLMISPEYNNKCIFQPGSYPGVKLQYYYNADSECATKGICTCAGKYCEGKGSGAGQNQCKKVTICIFESGKILITGANAFDQLNEAYGYIKKILADHHEMLCKIAH